MVHCFGLEQIQLDRLGAQLGQPAAGLPAPAQAGHSVSGRNQLWNSSDPHDPGCSGKEDAHWLPLQSVLISRATATGELPRNYRKVLKAIDYWRARRRHSLFAPTSSYNEG